jgi:hypothetical protein
MNDDRTHEEQKQRSWSRIIGAYALMFLLTFGIVGGMILYNHGSPEGASVPATATGR